MALDYSVVEQCWWAEVDGQRIALNLEAVDEDGIVQAMVDESQWILPSTRGSKVSSTWDSGRPKRWTQCGHVRMGRTAAPPTIRGPSPKTPVVNCPITGEVLSVPVAVGQQVTEGETLVVVK